MLNLGWKWPFLGKFDVQRQNLTSGIKIWCYRCVPPSRWNPGKHFKLTCSWWTTFHDFSFISMSLQVTSWPNERSVPAKLWLPRPSLELRDGPQTQMPGGILWGWTTKLAPKLYPDEIRLAGNEANHWPIQQRWETFIYVRSVWKIVVWSIAVSGSK